MSIKMGRNDFCFCGSGKKYKHCCLGKEQNLRHTVDIPWPTVPEEYALQNILTPGEPFQAFYKAERMKINEPIFWANNASLGGKTTGLAIRLPPLGTQVICLRQLPVRTEDAFTAAHEIMHLILDAEGFPFTAGLPEYQSLVGPLNSSVQDPLIDARLQQYGFDLCKKYENEIEGAVSKVQRAVPPPHRLAKIMWIMNYTSTLLDWKATKDYCSKINIDAFEHWFNKNQPSIAAEGKQLASVIEQIGYDTPDKMEEVYKYVIKKYKLSPNIIVRRKGEMLTSSLSDAQIL